MSFNFAVDHDPVLICPYDENHKIAKSRIQRHLVKCEKNFPPNFKKQCPYDATHRVFEYELVEHVKNCPMKHTCPIDIGQSKPVSSDMVVREEIENKISEEIWDEDLPDESIASNQDERFDFEQSYKQRSDMFVVKHYSNKLRRPFGYSESLMIETNSVITDDDAMSVTSDMGIGRGRSIPATFNGQYRRGTNYNTRMGIRGRMLP